MADKNKKETLENPIKDNKTPKYDVFNLDDIETDFIDALEETDVEPLSIDALLIEEKDEQIAKLEKALVEKDKKIEGLEADNTQLKELTKSTKRQHERLEEQFNVKSERKIQNFIKDQFLPTVDSLENALTYIEVEKDIEGIKGILTNCYNELATLNIEKIDAKGQSFNPEFHDALAIISDTSKDDNTVLTVQETGYKNSKTGILIRPSKVIVNKRQ